VRPVSVVIPAYNKWPAIVKVFSALSLQLEPQDEVIIVDDGSDDETLRLLEMFEGVHYIRQERLGWRLQTARNRGVTAAKNDCIVILDADCIPSPFFLDVYRRCFDPDLLMGGRIDRLRGGGTVDMDLTRLRKPGWSYIDV